LTSRRRAVLTQPTDLHDVVGLGFVHSIEFPAADDDVRRVRAGAFAKASAGEHLVVGSATRDEFSWELINRMIVTEPRLDSEPVGVETLVEGGHVTDSALILAPSLLNSATALAQAGHHANAAVILARTGLSVVADIHEAAELLNRHHLAVVAAVAVTSGRHRWRKWRRFAEAFGVGRDPQRPWPLIDVLEDEIAGTRRLRRSQP
jgi:hypothetical protein